MFCVEVIFSVIKLGGNRALRLRFNFHVGPNWPICLNPKLYIRQPCATGAWSEVSEYKTTAARPTSGSLQQRAV